VVGCADSGLDYGHCFFADTSAAPRGFSASNEEAPNHRKIIAYYSFAGVFSVVNVVYALFYFRILNCFSFIRCYFCCIFFFFRNNSN